MSEYRVTWTVDITADSPRDAARQALEMQRDAESTATVFEVSERGADGAPVSVDLGALHVDYELYATDLPQDCIEECSASGPVDGAVSYWRERLGFTVDRERAIACLRGYGAWDDSELAADSDETLAERILWLACGNFRDYQVSPETGGADVFVLQR